MTSQNLIITGVSSGFGNLALEPLLKKGHRILACLRGGTDRFQECFPIENSVIQTALRSKQLVPVDLHLDQPDSFRNLEIAVAEVFDRRVDILINNAGYGLMGPVETISNSELRYQFEVNFFGTVSVTQLLLPYIKTSCGKIISVSSVVGIVSMPYYGAYAASKHALEAYMEALHSEMRPFGVQVALVQPGGFKTKFIDKIILSHESKNSASPYFREAQVFKKKLLKKNQQLSGNPQRVVNLFENLCAQKHIGFRYPIGMDAWTLTVIKHVLPDGFRVWASRFFFKLLFLKG